jgi:hypothetical protein
MESPAVSEKQAYLVAISLLRGDKSKDDYGYAATYESLKIMENKLEKIERQEEVEKALITKPVDPKYAKYNI